VLCIDKHKALSSLNGLYFSTYSDTLAVPEHPPTVMSGDVADLIRLSHGCSFRFLGVPAEALPPRAAIRLRSSGLSFRLRANPAFRAIWLRSVGLNFLDLAAPPSLPSAEACGLGIFCFIEATLSKRHVRVNWFLF
jgi:hypothetical protein